MSDILKDLREKERVEKFLEARAMNQAITKRLIILYHQRVPPVEAVMKLGIHLKTAERYYKLFGSMTETEFEDVLKFCFWKSPLRRLGL